jgi:hypothetical protein
MDNFIQSKILIIVLLSLLVVWLWPSPVAGVPVLIAFVLLLLRLKEIHDDLRK